MLRRSAGWMAAVVLLALPATAHGAAGDLGVGACIGQEGTSCATAMPPGSRLLDHIAAVATGPSGSDVYAVAPSPDPWTQGGVVHFRLHSDGTLVFADCAGDAPGCTVHAPGHPVDNVPEPFADARDLVVTPDGRQLYVGVYSAIFRFDLADDGSLSYAGCAWDCEARWVPAPTRVLAISPDGRDIVGVAQRELIDLRRAPDGSLHFGQCFGDMPDCRFPSLEFGFDAAFSPDGSALFSPEGDGGDNVLDGASVERVDRAPDGRLTERQCLGRHWCRHEIAGTTDALTGAWGIAVTADGAHVVTTGGGVHTADLANDVPVGSITSLGPRADGTLALESCVGAPQTRGCVPMQPGGRSLETGLGRVVTAGRDVYDLTGGVLHHVVVAPDGTLVPAGCFGAPDGCLGGRAYSTAYGVRPAITPDGRWLIVPGQGELDVLPRVPDAAAPPRAPGARTVVPAPDAVDATSALLGGVVAPHGALTSWHVEWGAGDGDLDHRTADEGAGTGEAERPEAVRVDGLQPGTRYRFRLVARNDEGTVAGAIEELTTPSQPRGDGTGWLVSAAPATGYRGPCSDVAADGAGGAWACEDTGEWGYTMVHVHADGTVHHVELGDYQDLAQEIADGADGVLWVLGGQRLLRRAADGATLTLSFEDAGGDGQHLTVAPDGAAWFAHGPYDGVWHADLTRVDAEGRVRAYPLPQGTALSGAAALPGGRIAYADAMRGTIGILDPADGSVRERRLPRDGAAPTAIAADPAGRVLYVDEGGARVGRVTADGAPSDWRVQEWDLGIEYAYPSAVTEGRGGHVFVAEPGVGQIAELDTETGALAQHVLPEDSQQPRGIAASGGRVWWADRWHPWGEIGPTELRAPQGPQGEPDPPASSTEPASGAAPGGPGGATSAGGYGTPPAATGPASLLGASSPLGSVLPATGRSGPGGTSTARPGCRIALSSARARGRLVAGVLAADGRRCTVTASVWSLTSRRRLTAIRRLHAPPAGQTIAFTLRASRRLPATVVLRLAARAADGRIGDVRRVVLHVRRAAAVRFSRR